MSVVKLTTTIVRAARQIDVLHDYYRSSCRLEPKLQYLIAEVITLRLFAILEDGISEIAYKLAAGAIYLSGRNPRLFIQSKSLAMARDNMINYNRPRGIQLRWSKASYIKESVKYVIDPSEDFVNTASIHTGIINEMRVVRNFIAHRNYTSRKEFRLIINQRFGTELKISIGPFLLSTKRVSRPIIDEYLIQTKIILNDFAKG
jgi:hypothetical protein